MRLTFVFWNAWNFCILQFSVTEHYKGQEVGQRTLPGVFFFYDLSAIKVCFISVATVSRIKSQIILSFCGSHFISYERNGEVNTRLTRSPWEYFHIGYSFMWKIVFFVASAGDLHRNTSLLLTLLDKSLCDCWRYMFDYAQYSQPI